MLRDIYKPTISLFLICFIVTLSLAVTNYVTADTIEERARIDAENARKEVLSMADSFETIENLEELLLKDPDLGSITEAYKGIKDKNTVGYVFVVIGKGYGGDIKINVGMGTSGEIKGVKISESKETPGLGLKASDESFISQFFNIIPQGPLKVVKSNKSEQEEVQAISGATVTSRAVTGAVQKAVDAMAIISGKEEVK